MLPSAGATERLMPFDSSYIDAAHPYHEGLIAVEPMPGLQATGAERRHDIATLEGDPEEEIGLSFEVPLFWANTNFNGNSKLILSRAKSLARAIRYVTTLAPAVQNPRAWCRRMAETEARLRVQVEFSSVVACGRSVTRGLYVERPPVLDSVTLQSDTNEYSSPGVFIELQYVCPHCHMSDEPADRARDILFKVQALAYLKPEGRFTLKSLAVPVLLQP